VGTGAACPKEGKMLQVSSCKRQACATTTKAPKATTTKAPTSAGTFSTAAAWHLVDHSRTTHGDWTPTNGVADARAKGVWDSNTRNDKGNTHVHVAAKIEDRHGTCTNGDRQVPDGWKGAGRTATTYCNLCTCVAGAAEVICTKRKCGVASKTAAAGWATCDAVTCTATKITPVKQAGTTSADWTHPIPEKHWAIQVQHSHAEHMKKHVCTFNKRHFPRSEACTCKCAMPYKAYTQEAQHGTFDFGGMAASKCNTIHFKHPYNPSGGAVHVSASASYSTAANAANDAAHVWVQSTTHDRFTLCARSPFAYRHEQAASTTFIGQFYAYQGGAASWASGGGEEVQGLDTQKIACQTIAFGKSYDKAPMVIGTIDFNGSQLSLADTKPRVLHREAQLTSWVEDVNAQQFRVCFHNEGQLAAAATAKPHYNWIAFEHANPSNWFNEASLPYSMGGRVAAGAWSKYAGTWHEASKFGMGTWNACKTVEFGKSFTSAPTVLVTANHEDSMSMDWSHAPHPETQTWIDHVSTTSFKVCSTERASTSGDRDNSLKWDWIAFGEDAIAIAA